MPRAPLTADLVPAGVTAATTSFATPTGEVDAIVFRPASGAPHAAAPHPAVAIGAEATGVNRFILRTAADLATLGYVTCVPDYYRGGGQDDPDDYSDIPEIMRHIEALDFGRGTHDIMAAIDHLRRQGDVDAARVAVLGYCTGGTLALLAACLRRDLAAAVLFYPSQPVFPELTAKRPTHPMDLLWNLACPTMFVYGDRDAVMPPERLALLRRRLEQWEIDHVLRIFPGAAHSFGAPVPQSYDPDTYEKAWREATEFLANACQPWHVP
jgi:carboxymethylenebutenolidase